MSKSNDPMNIIATLQKSIKVATQEAISSADDAYNLVLFNKASWNIDLLNLVLFLVKFQIAHSILSLGDNQGFESTFWCLLHSKKEIFGTLNALIHIFLLHPCAKLDFIKLNCCELSQQILVTKEFFIRDRLENCCGRRIYHVQNGLNCGRR